MSLTVLDSLVGVTGYPVPERTAGTIALKRGLSLTDTSTGSILNSRAFRLAEADVLMWLSRAANVGQGGQSYSFTDAQRDDFRRRAKKIYDEIGDPSDKGSGTQYGYMGRRL